MTSFSEEELFEVTCADDINDNNAIVYQCSACDISFPNVDEHLKEFHENLQLESDEIQIQQEVAVANLDDDKVEEVDEFDGVAFVIKNSDGKFECKDCFRTFQSVKRFITHVKTHNSVQDEEDIHKLEEYIKQLEERENVFEEIEDESGQKSYCCKVCMTVFSTRKKMLLHYPIHTNVAAAHKKRVYIETTEDLLHCKLCNRSLNNAYELEMHLSAHEENSAHGSNFKPAPVESQKKRKKGEYSYPCQYCQKEFKRPHEKVKHERIHTNEKPYSCDICGKTFRVTYCLSLHKRNVHSDERPYVCSFEGCNKRFKSQSVYNHHLKTHGSERNYKCPFCTKSFKTSVQLAGHKNTHTKPFSCQVCSRAFASLYAVKIHTEVHRNLDVNLKYTCKICSAQYGRSFALSDHMKTAHGGIEVETKVCDEHFEIEESPQETSKTEFEEVYSVVMVSEAD